MSGSVLRYGCMGIGYRVQGLGMVGVGGIYGYWV